MDTYRNKLAITNEKECKNLDLEKFWAGFITESVSVARVITITLGSVAKLHIVDVFVGNGFKAKSNFFSLTSFTGDPFHLKSLACILDIWHVIFYYACLINCLLPMFEIF